MSFWSDPIGFIREWVLSLLASTGMAPGAVQVVGYILGAFILATGAMLFVIFLIWLERKLIGRIQDRFGPNRVGPWGIFQPVADMLKIFTKEYITPSGADKVPYNLAPILSVAAVLLVWAVIPFAITMYGVDLNVGILYIIAVGALGEMGIILAGWGSNNKYALLGAFRSVAQLISYEVPMVVSALIPVMMSGSMSMNQIIQAQDVWYIVVSPAAAIIFFITSVAEIGRAPFDLTEAESELVAGFNIEYSGLKFGMFFVADFLHAFTVSLIFATLFLGGWRGPGAAEIPILGFVYFVIKTSAVYFLIILMRGTLPRFRIDQMMDLNWKLLTPFSLITVMVVALVDRLLTDFSNLIRIGALVLANGVILVFADRFLGKVQKRRVAREVSGKDRPVARPENYFTQPGSGA